MLSFVEPDKPVRGRREDESHTIFGYLHNGIDPIPQSIGHSSYRIQIGKTFENPIPAGPAKQGQDDGKWNVGIDHPGIPTKKYRQSQKENNPEIRKNHRWTVQNIYTAKETETEVSTYVGWTAKTLYDNPKVDDEMRRSVKIRDTFLKTIAEELPDKRKKVAVDLLGNFEDRPKHIFWYYEDQSYFHSAIQLNYGLPRVFYMNLRENMVEPPNFKYSTFNIIASGLYASHIEYSDFNLRPLAGHSDRSSCESSRCRCDTVFEHKFPEKKNILPNESGGIIIDSCMTNSILIECSNSCRCSMLTCPRRRLQRGQTKMLVVFYKDNVTGFEVKAAEEFKKGEFICEFVGEVKRLDPHESNRGPFKAGFKSLDEDLIIDSSEIGNIARFIKTSSNPNAIFIETYSRERLTFPLIPRISVYALEDIGIGKSITVASSQGGQPTFQNNNLTAAQFSQSLANEPSTSTAMVVLQNEENMEMELGSDVEGNVPDVQQ